MSIPKKLADNINDHHVLHVSIIPRFELGD
jgi:hypothetical protein